MKYISTNSISTPVSLDEAVNKCIPSDGGLFMPEKMPLLPKAFYRNIGEMNLREIAYVVATTFFGQDVDVADLKHITDQAFGIDVPMVQLGDNTYILELFHGPTLTYKDFGARFMAHLLSNLDRRAHRRRNVLVATNGNTGAAAANGMLGLEDINVSVLYPKGQLTRMQVAQITALGENIHPVEVVGSVEDCKRLVHQAILEPTFAKFNLTGANSVNIARLIPQATFAFYAYARLKAMGVREAEQALYSIPCGNLSNVVAATIARRMGLPMGPIVAAVNANNQIAPCVRSEAAGVRQPVRTLSPSIDMSYPTGFPRLSYLYGGDMAALQREIVVAEPIMDDDIRATILAVQERNSYTLDPHGAVAYAAAEANVNSAVPRVIFATGHPAKQYDIMKNITGNGMKVPPQLERFATVRRHATLLPPSLPALKKLLQTIK